MRPCEVRGLFHDYGWDWNGYAKFVFVRNPWARLVSLYQHICTEEASPPFSEWLYTMQPNGLGGDTDMTCPKLWKKYGAYSIEHYIKDDSGNILVDKVLRLEDINHKLIPYLTALHIPIDIRQKLPYKNQRQVAMGFQEYDSARTANHVRHLYHYDIVNYGYEFSL